jgi:hypothetical protein
MTKLLPALVCLLLLTTACGSDDDSPTAPTTPTPVTPAPAATTAALTITPSTLQVTGGSTPSGFAAECTDKPNFWQWNVTITETAGVPVTLTTGITLADGQVLSTNTLSVAIPARGSVTRSPFQCWTQGNGHTAQVTYSGTDANGHQVTATSPTIALLPR